MLQRIEHPQRRRGLAPQLLPLRHVVVAGDLAGAVILLEVTQGRVGRVPPLEQLDPGAIRLGQPILGTPALGREEGPGHRDDGGADKQGDGDRRGCRAHASRARAAAYRRAICRASRGSGQIVISAPSRNTAPASQISPTIGLTRVLIWTERPSAEIAWRMV